MFGLGPTELIVVLVIVLLLFGGKKLPELARALGKSISEFKKGKDDGFLADASKAETKSVNQDSNEKKSA